MSSGILFAQRIKGDGNVVSQSRTLPSFNKIYINGVINVNLEQGASESAKVETDANLINYVVTNVNDGVLEIGIKENVDINHSTKMLVNVTLKNVDEITNSGVGNIDCNGTLNLENLKLENDGVGNVTINLNCNKLEADVNSVGGLSLSGKASAANIENNSIGNIEAFDLYVDVLKIDNNSVGNAQVNSNKEIYIELNGIGNVSYKGNAVVKALNINGIGKVVKE